MKPMSVELVPISDLSFDPDNARKHNPKNLRALEGSLRRFGQQKPIVITSENTVAAGNGTLMAARALGWKEIQAVRVPDSWTAAEIKAFALADNRTAELAEWDQEVLASQLLDLEELDFDIAELGFEVAEIPVDGESSSPSESTYTNKINVPQYEIVGDKPSVLELMKTEKAESLRQSIMSTKMDAELREFLLAAASRHTVFNYRKIAEFYPHAPAEIQKLMEESALIIIDAEDAIRYGFANFMDVIDELESADREEA